MTTPLSQCILCAHYRGSGACDAYPDGIPQPILANLADHTKPLPGDSGIQFEQAEGRPSLDFEKELGTKDAGHWVTIDDKPVFIEGPAQGAGGAEEPVRVVGVVPGSSGHYTVYRGTRMPDEILSSDMAKLFVVDDEVVASEVEYGMWHSAIQLHADMSAEEYDRSTRINQMDPLGTGMILSVYQGFVGLGPGEDPAVGMDVVAKAAEVLLRAGYDDDTLLVYNNNRLSGGTISLKLREWVGRKSLGSKRGRFITLGEGDDRRVIFIEGPAQGAGQAAPTEGGATVLTSRTPVRDELLKNKTVYEYSGDTSYRATIKGEGNTAILMTSPDYHKLTPDDFDPDAEYERIQFTLKRMREILREEPDFVEAIDRNGDIMTRDPDRRIGYNIVFTANDESAGAGSGGPGSAKVFYVPYEYEDRREMHGFGPWDKLGIDPIYVTVHETHHAFGSSSELDLFSDVVAVDVHLRLGNTLAPDNVRQQIASLIRWGDRHASGEWKDSIYQHRKAVRWLRDNHRETLGEIMEEIWDKETAAILDGKIARWRKMMNPGEGLDERVFWQREYVSALSRTGDEDTAAEWAMRQLEMQRRLIRFEGVIDSQDSSMTIPSTTAGRGTKEEARWVTIDDRPVLIGGPRQGRATTRPQEAEAVTVSVRSGLSDNEAHALMQEVKESWYFNFEDEHDPENERLGVAALAIQYARTSYDPDVPELHFIELREDGNLMGVATMARRGERRYRPASDFLVLEYMATRQPGYGRRLFSSVMQVAGQGDRDLVWETLPSAKGFYNAMGFTPAYWFDEGGLTYRISAREARAWSGGIFNKALGQDLEPENGVFAIEDKEASRWVTIDDRPVLIGGPRQGSGTIGTEDLDPGSGVHASSRVFSFEGQLYRAEDADTTTKVGLGPATYLTDREDVARGYGSDVRAYWTSLPRVLGTNSPEYEALRKRAMYLWNNTDAVLEYEHPIYLINELARDAGYDAFWSGSVYGMAVFDRDNLHDLGAKEAGRWVTIEDRPVFIGGPGQGAGAATGAGRAEPASPTEVPPVGEWGPAVVGFERELAALPRDSMIERFYIVSQDGTVLLDEQGGEKRVEIPVDERFDGGILTHNHPGLGYSFSRADIVTAGMLRLNEIRAVGWRGDDLYRYRFIIDGLEQYDRHMVAHWLGLMYDKARKKSERDVLMKIHGGEISRKEADDWHYHLVMQHFVNDLNQRRDEKPLRAAYVSEAWEAETGEKQGRFVTLGEGAGRRVVFIEGPGQGRGATSSEGAQELPSRRATLSREVSAKRAAALRDEIDDWDGKRAGYAGTAVSGAEHSGLALLEYRETGELKGIASLGMPHKRFSIMDDEYIWVGNSISIHHLATKERGHGRTMMVAIAEQAAEHDWELAWNATDESMGFYRSLGFKPSGGLLFVVDRDEVKAWLSENRKALEDSVKLEPKSGIFTNPEGWKQDHLVKRDDFEDYDGEENKKETAHWVTIDERPVLIGGPGQGAGTTRSVDPQSVRLQFVPSEEQVELVRDVALGNIEEAMKHFDADEDEIVERMQQQLSEDLKEPVCIRASAKSARKILEDERFKTQFEVGDSGGVFSPGMRRSAEHFGLGAPDDLPDEQRPVYGYLDTPWAGADIYGPIKFVLRDEVKQRSTYAIGDTLHAFRHDWATGVPFSSLDSAGWDKRVLPYLSQNWDKTWFIETQIQGGVTLKDVARVVIHWPDNSRAPGRDAYFEAVVDAAKGQGIDVEVIRE